MQKPSLEALHKNVFKNARHVLSAKKCGCILCLSTFEPSEIKEFWDSEKTAICPYCGVDSVLFDSKEIFITENLLREVRRYAWNGYMDHVTPGSLEITNIEVE